jgi:hypothetical protein
MSGGSIAIDRRKHALSAAILLLAVLPPSVLSPQVPVTPGPVADVSIRLQSAAGSPVEGALVALLNVRDSVVAEGLSTEGGTRVLRAPPGTYRVRARRIGFLPFISTPVALPQPDQLLLVVETQKVVLNRVVVEARSECKSGDPAAQSLGVVWDEIDKALRASQLTTRDLAGFGQGRTFRRELGAGGAVISSDSTRFFITNMRPFGAIDPDTLARVGYVRGDELNGWEYFAPDETVLRSEPFAQTHCFRLVREKARPGQIGVGFAPTPGRKVADIEGVLWLDEASSELREVVFLFVNAGPVSRYDAGGFTRFVRASSGAWLVSEWRLRGPRLRMEYSPYAGRRITLIGYVENGGGILGADRRAPPDR